MWLVRIKIKSASYIINLCAGNPDYERVNDEFGHYYAKKSETYVFEEDMIKYCGHDITVNFDEHNNIFTTRLGTEFPSWAVEVIDV